MKPRVDILALVLSAGSIALSVWTLLSANGRAEVAVRDRERALVVKLAPQFAAVYADFGVAPPPQPTTVEELLAPFVQAVESVKGAKLGSLPVPDATSSIAERLSRDLGVRRSWPVHAVKLALRQPEVVRAIPTTSGRLLLIHGWAHNDYNTPMVRLDSGDTLYELSRAEWQELCLTPSS